MAIGYHNPDTTLYKKQSLHPAKPTCYERLAPPPHTHTPSTTTSKKRFYGHLWQHLLSLLSCVSSQQWLHFSTPIGKEFGLVGGAQQKETAEIPSGKTACLPGIQSKYGKTNKEWNIVL
jgi:hypothetical protein